MKKLFKPVIVAIFLINTLQIFPQAIVDLVDVQAAVERNIGVSNSDVEGSPYINEEYEMIRLSNFEKQIFQGRFNAFNGNMEVNHKDQNIILDSSKDIEVFFIKSNKFYKTLTFENKNSEIKRGFLVVLYQSDSISLYKKENIRFMDAIEATSGYSQKKPAKFLKDTDDYYIKYKNKINYTLTNKKDFLKAFPEKNSELKSYMKEKKLNPKNEDDLIKLVEYLSSISA